MASKGHLRDQSHPHAANEAAYFLTQIPQPIHSSSEMNAFLSAGLTSIHSFPIFTTGHERLHSWRLSHQLHIRASDMLSDHFFGLHCPVRHCFSGRVATHLVVRNDSYTREFVRHVAEALSSLCSSLTPLVL